MKTYAERLIGATRIERISFFEKKNEIDLVSDALAEAIGNLSAEEAEKRFTADHSRRWGLK